MSTNTTSPFVRFVAMLFLCTAPMNAQMNAPAHLMPLPEKIALSDGKLVIDGTLRCQVTGYSDALLERAAARFLQNLRKKTGIPFAPGAAASGPATLKIHCGHAGEPVQSVAGDESYTLEVTAASASLAAPAPLGILRGLETLLQLVDLDEKSFFVPCLKIEDRPRFRWRGLLIDVSRHWEPI